MKALEEEAGGWTGGKSFRGAYATQNIKYNGAGGSSYRASNNKKFTTTSGKTVQVISSSQTTGGGSSYNTSNSEHRNGLGGSVSIVWAGY